MIWIVLVYHAALVLLAYWIGRNSAGPGVFTFLAGVALFQVVVNGPSSFIGSECPDYGPQLQAIDYC